MGGRMAEQRGYGQPSGQPMTPRPMSPMVDDFQGSGQVGGRDVLGVLGQLARPRTMMPAGPVAPTPAVGIPYQQRALQHAAQVAASRPQPGQVFMPQPQPAPRASPTSLGSVRPKTAGGPGKNRPVGY